MSMMIVMTTVDTRACAEQIARSLLDKRYAACIQIEEICSLYHWLGNIETSNEYRLMIKTPFITHQNAITCIEKQHPYTTPEILWYPVCSSEAYLQWAQEQTSAHHQ